MKVETIEEIAKRLGQQKGKNTHSYYGNNKTKGVAEGLAKKIIGSLTKKEK